MLQPVFGHISDSVAYFISPISTGLDRKTRPGLHTTLPCEGRGGDAWLEGLDLHPPAPQRSSSLFI